VQVWNESSQRHFSRSKHNLLRFSSYRSSYPPRNGQLLCHPRCRVELVRTTKLQLDLLRYILHSSTSKPFIKNDVDPILSSISPSTGSPVGGALVAITGSGFISNPNVLCSFGEFGNSEAFFHSSTSLSCISRPCYFSGCDSITVYIQIALNGIQFTNSTALPFTYLSMFYCMSYRVLTLNYVFKPIPSPLKIQNTTSTLLSRLVVSSSQYPALYSSKQSRTISLKTNSNL